MKFRIKRASRPGWEHNAEAGSVDEILRYLRVVHREDRFLVDCNPWEGFERDNNGGIVRDAHGIGKRASSGVVEVTIFDRDSL